MPKVKEYYVESMGNWETLVVCYEGMAGAALEDAGIPLKDISVIREATGPEWLKLGATTEAYRPIFYHKLPNAEG